MTAASLADILRRLDAIERHLGIALPAPPPDLTRRQWEVARLIAAGRKNHQIAAKLGLTEGTVKIHVAAVMKALGVTSRTEVAGVIAESAENTSRPV